MRRSRHLISAASGLTALTAATCGLLLAEAWIARRQVGRPHGEVAPIADGWYGYRGASREPLRMVMLGDSTAAGLGMMSPGETPAALVAEGLAAVAEGAVRLTNVAETGAVSADLEWQVAKALPHRPDIAVIFIGANDVTSRASIIAPPVRHLRAAVRRLREAGAEVVVGTCPDLGWVEPIAQPLRWLTRRWSRQLAAAQTIAVREEGGRTVALGDLLGPDFLAYPGEMFGPDRFHPSSRGYVQAAYAVLPSVCAALGLWSEPEPQCGDGVLPIYLAAAASAEKPEQVA